MLWEFYTRTTWNIFPYSWWQPYLIPFCSVQIQMIFDTCMYFMFVFLFLLISFEIHYILASNNRHLIIINQSYFLYSLLFLFLKLPRSNYHFITPWSVIIMALESTTLSRGSQSMKVETVWPSSLHWRQWDRQAETGSYTSPLGQFTAPFTLRSLHSDSEV